MTLVLSDARQPDSHRLADLERNRASITVNGFTRSGESDFVGWVAEHVAFPPVARQLSVRSVREQVALRFSCSGWLSSVTPRPIRPLPRGVPVVVNDASGQSATLVAEVAAVASCSDAEVTLERARASGARVSIAGRRHSEGGQSAAPGSVNLDMLGLNRVQLLEDGHTVRVEAGATWADVQAALRPHGRAVKVMQASNVFTVGGSLSVNCHGRTPRQPPLISTVKEIRLLTAEGDVAACSREQNADLFRHAIGGYGLFGVIVDADIETTEDARCRLDVQLIDMNDYPQVFAETLDDPSIELAYGRIAPMLTGEMLFHRVRRDAAASNSSRSLNAEARLWPLWRLAIEASKHDRRLLAARWALEKRARHGSPTGSRNSFMAPNLAPLRQFRINEGRKVDILHEYYIPYASYLDFINELKTAQSRLGTASLNITVRDVGADHESALPYARQDSYSFVLYYNQTLSPAGAAQQAELQRTLIDLATSLGGTFYLPYQVHYTREQLQAAYPQIGEFLATKRRLDPDELFTNTWYEHVRDGSNLL
jgi:FAD/FMN-containing dehydrogenase